MSKNIKIIIKNKVGIVAGLLLITSKIYAGDIDMKTTVKPAIKKKWETFSLSNVRLLPSSPFYRAMMVDQKYLIDADVDRMLNGYRSLAKVPLKYDYPGSNQPEGTRPVDLNHYLSAISLMYGQTGDERFKQRAIYIVQQLNTLGDKLIIQKKGSDTIINHGLNRGLQSILNGKIELDGTDETGYPWGGTMGNDWYGIHKHLAALRDAYLYCDDKTALGLWIDQSNTITEFALRANPDFFDDMLDIEHGGMNEVFADLYGITGDKRYMAVSIRFNHQKVILNIANHTDVLYGRHVNMQVPTFVGTARQYQLTGNVVSGNATKNFLDIVYHSYMSCIGGSGRYERYGRPGEITKSLGYTADETCATYNMLKVALNYFESTGDLQHMDYFERGLYNHILASQDPESGGVTYYTSLMPGGFKAFSKGFDLEGVWCCVGTGMENHAKYGEAIYFNNGDDLLVNLFIPSTLNWQQKGLKLEMQTSFPETDKIKLLVNENKSFNKAIDIRYPSWVKRPVKIWINNKLVKITAQPGEYIRLNANWKKGDVILIDMPQDFRLETASDDPQMATIFHGPLVMAGELGAARLPGSDLVRHALNVYKTWVPPTDDIPVLVADKANLNSWIKPGNDTLKFQTYKAGILNGKQHDVSLIPYYMVRHERYNVYWKIFTPLQMQQRNLMVSDEINVADKNSENSHHLTGSGDDTSTIKDDRHYWENNRIGRNAKNGGWFAYDLKLNKGNKHYLTVTYWGSASKNTTFDVVVNGKVIQTEDNYDRWPITYFEQVYEIPASLTQGKDSINVRFQTSGKSSVGGVYALKMSSDNDTFPGYLFY